MQAEHSVMVLSHSPWAAALPAPEEMRALEQRAIAAGTPVAELMESAGEAVASMLGQWYGTRLQNEGPIVILCGPGNNGGDGLVTARYLQEAGADVHVVVVYAQKYSPLLTDQLKRFMQQSDRVYLFADKGATLEKVTQVIDRSTLSSLLASAWMIVDALLGVGQQESPRGAIRVIIECVKEVLSRAGGQQQCIAVDVPTGVNCSSGQVYAPAIEAHATITIEAPKRGMLQYPARAVCGRITAAPIGITLADGCEFSVITPEDAALQLPGRSPQAHKGDFGQVAVIAGSTSYPGAAELVCRAALRTGAGLVTKVDVGDGARSESWPEIVHRSVVRDAEGAWLYRLCEQLKKSRCAVIGPGLGVAVDTAEMLQALLNFIEKDRLCCVLDADCLNVMSREIAAGRVFSLPQAVLTPHPGEAARLLGCRSEDVQRDRYQAVREIAQRTSATVVLKGASSIVYNARHGFVNVTGNPYMATPGSGDVLAGMIGARVAAGQTPLDAAVCAVYYHGLAGDLAHDQRRTCIIASDIIEAIPQALSTPASARVVRARSQS